MAFSDFTLEMVARAFGIQTKVAELFPDVKAVAVSGWLADVLDRGSQGVRLSMLNEKSRSEFIVAPLLLACRELSGNRFVIFSGQRLDVDSSQGLTGECDFILSASPPILPLQAPIAMVV